jgi:hypothetical protein
MEPTLSQIQLKGVVLVNRPPFEVVVEDGKEIVVVAQGGGGAAPAVRRSLRITNGTLVCVAMNEKDLKLKRHVEERGGTVLVDGRPVNIKVVSLSEDVYEAFYGVIASDRDWLTQHGLYHRRYSPFRCDRDHHEAWKKYRIANNKIAEEIMSLQPNVVWIQDHHFRLVPGILRQMPNVVINQFLHGAAGRADFWEIWPPKQQKEILLGMCGNDTVFFHTPDDVRDFLEWCRKGPLGVEVDFENGIVKGGELGDRVVRVVAHPIGIETDQFERLVEDPKVDEERRNFLHSLASGVKTVVEAMGRMDLNKGHLNFLKACERLAPLLGWIPFEERIKDLKYGWLPLDQALARLSRDDLRQVHRRLLKDYPEYGIERSLPELKRLETLLRLRPELSGKFRQSILDRAPELRRRPKDRQSVEELIGKRPDLARLLYDELLQASPQFRGLSLRDLVQVLPELTALVYGYVIEKRPDLRGEWSYEEIRKDEQESRSLPRPIVQFWLWLQNTRSKIPSYQAYQRLLIAELHRVAARFGFPGAPEQETAVRYEIGENQHKTVAHMSPPDTIRKIHVSSATPRDGYNKMPWEELLAAAAANLLRVMLGLSEAPPTAVVASRGTGSSKSMEPWLEPIDDASDPNQIMGSILRVLSLPMAVWQWRHTEGVKHIRKYDEGFWCWGLIADAARVAREKGIEFLVTGDVPGQRVLLSGLVKAFQGWHAQIPEPESELGIQFL